MLCSNNISSSEEVAVATTFRLPFDSSVKYHRTSPFGYRTDPFTKATSFHDGIDLSAPAGTNILASADGVVDKTGFETGGLGNFVYIKHEYNGTTYFTAYGHMSDNSIVVTKGQKVKQGDKIGVIGTTGNSTGIHLHFMIMSPIASYKKEYLVNPSLLVEVLK